MRLTLRTLLAYMDEILEPTDREELAKKVETSDFANDLIHRTKDTMRRLRLSAPQVVGTGMGLDPNTVAEYLDNVLPPDSVADFERICLESDVHLAEVASCHHVLTMVLGEPAEVDPAARQRMYGIPAEAESRKRHRIEAAHAAAGADRKVGAATLPPAHAARTAGTAPAASSRRDAIPDYLRASSWTRHHVLLAACAAVLLVAVTVLLKSGLEGWRGGERQLAANSSDVATPLTAAPSTHPVIPSPPANEGQSTAEDEATASPMVGAPPRLVLPPMSSSAVPPTAPATAEAQAESDARYAIESPTEDSQSPAANVASPPPTIASNTTAMPETTGATQSDETVADIGAETAVAPTTDLTAADDAADELSERATDLGTYLDGENLLVRFDPIEEAWFLMSSPSPVHAGDKLLALPAFYPKLNLASGLHLKLAGGTLLSLGTDSEDTSVPAIDVAYGKVVIVNTVNKENRVRLTLSGETAVAGLDPSATLAVSVEPEYVPGLDPRQTSSPVEVEVYVEGADVVWENASGSESISAPSHWNIADGVASAASADVEFPKWIGQEPVEPPSEKKYGAPQVRLKLTTARPVEEQLFELYQGSRQREFKSLVARSGVNVGMFVPFVEALRDSDQKSTWESQIKSLRSAMALSPESANKVWEALVEQRGEPAAHDLYEMLCGYSPEQIGGTPEEIQAGPVARLINWMENDNLDYRVLAVQVMWEITGERHLRNATASQIERARGVRVWRQRLKAGDIPIVTQ